MIVIVNIYIAKINPLPTSIQLYARKGLQNTKSRSSKEELRLFTVYLERVMREN